MPSDDERDESEVPTKECDAESSSSSRTTYLERMNRLRSLHARRNEARSLNHAEVVEEDRRSKLPANYESKKRRQDWQLLDMELRKKAEAEGEDYDQVKLLDIQADIADKMDGSKRRKKNPDQGFAGYEAMSLRQHSRLTKQLKGDREEYETMKKVMGEDFYPSANTLIQGTHYPTPQAMDKLVLDLDKQVEKREKYHRRRMYDPDTAVDYINERNRKFNQKVERTYGKYTDEIKQNLERGTAV